MEQFAKEPTMRTLPAAALLLAALVPAFLNAQEPPAKPKAPGLGDPGQLTAIAVETGRLKDGVVTISGRDAGQQIVVTGQYATGQLRDLSPKATYEVSPAGIVNVDVTGLITPIAEGEATVHVVGAPGIDGNIKVKVTNLVTDLAINFANQITPVFTK